ncbi:MAG: mechanosensitive ion channel family protein [Vicinamibacterales bacterium]
MNTLQRLLGHLPLWNLVVLAIALALVVAWAVAQLIMWPIRRVLLAAHDASPAHARAMRNLFRVVRGLLIFVLTLVLIPPLFELFGAPLNAGLTAEGLGKWALASGLRVLFIVTLAVVLSRIVTISIVRLERYVGDADGEPMIERLKRARTLGGLVRRVAQAFIYGAAAVMVLAEFQIDTKPLLAGAGILGLGIGFGAQTLVKDVISGFFLILENQIRVGDAAEINGASGMVEAITPRTIVLRDLRGAVHVISHGSVTALVNLTKDYAYALLDVRVAYQHNTDDVVEAIRQAADATRADPAFAAHILEPLQVLGIERLGEAGVVIRIRMKTVPLQQWEIARELRRRIKLAFDAKGIEIPPASSVFPAHNY